MGGYMVENRRMCPECLGDQVVKCGKSGDGRQRFVCRSCGHRTMFVEPRIVVGITRGKEARVIADRLLALGVGVGVIAKSTKIPERTVRYLKNKGVS